jgi:outer membrane protein
MKLLPLVAGGALLIGLTQPSLAQDADAGKTAGSVMVRLRGVGVLPQTSSSITPIGGHVEASDRAAPEIDASYFFTENIAVELVATTTRHRITAHDTAAGDVDVGNVRLLPPTLTAQWHFLPDQALSPYVGAGINYTWFFDTSVPHTVVNSVSYDDEFGAVIQAGLDYHITGRWYANLDVKQVFLNTTAKINGGAIRANVDLNPTIIGAGIGYRF